MKINHVVSIKYFLDKKLLDSIFCQADEFQKLRPPNRSNFILSGKIIASLFYEPSTRTRFSFEAAIHKLGGSVISTENASQFSSAIKGESLEDTIKTLNNYVDGIVIRHSQIGAAELAARYSTVPVFNAGDGSGEHPTQALLDLYTIKNKKGELNGLNIGLVGDLRNGRTIHSLIYLLGLYSVKIYLIAPNKIQLPEKYVTILKNKRVKFIKTANLSEVIDNLDVIYMTRIQKERFKAIYEYKKYENSFVIDKKLLSFIKNNAIIMHPLPRNNEISTDIDQDPRAVYFDQARNGLFIRMALFDKVYSN